ncbi:periplasmic or exported protein [Klebsiella michiganensis]|uniref:Periplasmic or exported protein n=1 Tax=Klebsiella michiganensis TaxID=1134687 RepID=A0A7H4PNA3_9ENTR|nr:periplasmic or exported protein [Klebsiella michiganensis]
MALNAAVIRRCSPLPLPLAKPQPLAGQTFTFSTYDPTYYVDMYYDKDADFTLPTAMKTSCTAKVMTPKPNEKNVVLRAVAG